MKEEIANITTKIVNVTPKLAAMWLSRNEHNRPLKKGHIDNLANQMKMDNWQINGETIKFANNGRLLDGQHRLHAVIKSGKTVAMEIREGLPTTTFETIDTGAKRSAGDILALNEVPYPLATAAALRNLYYYRKGNLIGVFNDKIKPSNLEIDALYKENPGVTDSLNFIKKLKARSFLNESRSAFLHYIFSEINREDADYFFERLGKGTGIDEDSPIYALREKLIRNATSKTSHSNKDILALMINAWNYYREGKSVKKIHIKDYTKDNFPTPK